jgi:hypothetical protein
MLKAKIETFTVESIFKMTAESMEQRGITPDPMFENGGLKEDIYTEMWIRNSCPFEDVTSDIYHNFMEFRHIVRTFNLIVEVHYVRG